MTIIPHQMKLIGHRGARGEAPENTLGGFYYLHNLGVRAVEFDVRQLRDGNLIVMHDADFERTTGICKKLQDCSLEDVRKFDHRLQWTLWPQKEPTPLLVDVLPILQDFEHIELEVKAVANCAAAQRLIHELMPLLNDWQDRVTITSFDLKILQCLHKYVPHFPRGLLVERDWTYRAVAKAKALGCKRIGLKDALATPQRIAMAHQAGLKVSVWTVNDPQRVVQLQQFGIDGLITDFPQAMLTQFQQVSGC